MKITTKIAKYLKQFPDIELAILFGSTAKGQAGVGSDIDLAVMARHALSAEERIKIVSDLALIFARPIDLIDLKTSSGLILKQILTSSRPFFCKDSTLYAELIKRMIFDQADVYPYRARILAERRQAWINS